MNEYIAPLRLQDFNFALRIHNAEKKNVFRTTEFSWRFRLKDKSEMTSLLNKDSFSHKLSNQPITKRLYDMFKSKQWDKDESLKKILPKIDRKQVNPQIEHKQYTIRRSITRKQPIRKQNHKQFNSDTAKKYIDKGQLLHRRYLQSKNRTVEVNASNYKDLFIGGVDLNKELINRNNINSHHYQSVD